MPSEHSSAFISCPIYEFIQRLSDVRLTLQAVSTHLYDIGTHSGCSGNTRTSFVLESGVTWFHLRWGQRCNPLCFRLIFSHI